MCHALSVGAARVCCLGWDVKISSSWLKPGRAISFSLVHPSRAVCRVGLQLLRACMCETTKRRCVVQWLALNPKRAMDLWGGNSNVTSCGMATCRPLRHDPCPNSAFDIAWLNYIRTTMHDCHDCRRVARVAKRSRALKEHQYHHSH